MDRHLDADDGGHPHGQVLIFRQLGEIPALRFQYISSAPIHQLEASFRDPQYRTEFQLHALD